MRERQLKVAQLALEIRSDTRRAFDNAAMLQLRGVLGQHHGDRGHRQEYSEGSNLDGSPPQAVDDEDATKRQPPDPEVCCGAANENPPDDWELGYADEVLCRDAPVQIIEVETDASQQSVSATADDDTLGVPDAAFSSAAGQRQAHSAATRVRTALARRDMLRAQARRQQLTQAGSRKDEARLEEEKEALRQAFASRRREREWLHWNARYARARAVVVPCQAQQRSDTTAAHVSGGVSEIAAAAGGISAEAAYQARVQERLIGFGRGCASSLPLFRYQ